MSTLEEVARFCEPGARRNYHKISLTRGPAHHRGRVHHARRARARPLHRQGRESAPAHAGPFPAASGLPRAAGARAAGAHRGGGDRLRVRRPAARGAPHRQARPLYNSHGTRVSSYHYAKLSADEYPRLYATPNLREDGSYYAGPFRKASVARHFVDCVNACLPATHLRTHAGRRRATARPHGAGSAPAVEAPWRSATGAGRSRARLPTSRHGRLPGALPGAAQREYGAVVDEVRRVLEGHSDELDSRCASARPAGEALAFEQAAKPAESARGARPGLRGVRRLQRRPERLRRARLPGQARRQGGLVGVRGGSRVVEREVGPRRSATKRRAASSPRVPRSRRGRRCRGAIDEILLVHGWLQRHRTAVNVFDLAGSWRRRAARRGRLQAAAAACAARTRPLPGLR